MSITAAVFVLVYVAGLALALWNPMAGLCAYLWAFYMNPPGNWWGQDLPDLRWSLIAALVTFVAYVLHNLSGAGSARRSVRGSEVS